MRSFTTKDGTNIFYKDWGSGKPIVFSHGWPLTADAWDAQMLFLGMRGYRVIAQRSARAWALGSDLGRNEMDTYAGRRGDSLQRARSAWRRIHRTLNRAAARSPTTSAGMATSGCRRPC